MAENGSSNEFERLSLAAYPSSLSDTGTEGLVLLSPGWEKQEQVQLACTEACGVMAVQCAHTHTHVPADLISSSHGQVEFSSTALLI